VHAATLAISERMLYAYLFDIKMQQNVHTIYDYCVTLLRVVAVLRAL